MTRAARRVTGAAALSVAIAFTAVACSDSDSDPGDPAAVASSATPTEAPVETQVSFGEVTGHLPAAARDELASEVTAIVDGWTQAAYLGGEYPRRDFSDAWPGFTAGAREDAHGDRALTSNEDIGDRIDGVDPHKSVVKIDVLAVRQRPVGVTARVYLGFATTGDVESQVRVKARLFLTRTDEGWQVFGYDVTKGTV